MNIITLPIFPEDAAELRKIHKASGVHKLGSSPSAIQRWFYKHILGRSNGYSVSTKTDDQTQHIVDIAKKYLSQIQVNVEGGTYAEVLCHHVYVDEYTKVDCPTLSLDSLRHQPAYHVYFMLRKEASSGGHLLDISTVRSHELDVNMVGIVLPNCSYQMQYFEGQGDAQFIFVCLRKFS